MERADVSKAFDMVLVRIQEAIDDLNAAVIEASRQEDFDQVQKLAERGKEMVHLRERVLGVQYDWHHIAAQPGTSARPLPSGALTPEAMVETDFSDESVTDELDAMEIPIKHKEDFYLPILSALVDLGGQARAEDVLDQLQATMAFSRIDLKSRPDGAPTRWMHTAHRARHDLVHEKGFLSSSAPRGVWVITDAGRQYLARSYEELVHRNHNEPMEGERFNAPQFDDDEV